MEVSERLAEVRGFIKKGEVDKALDSLLELSEDYFPDVYEDLLSLISEYHRLYREKNLGIGDQNSDLNRISKSTIEIFSKVNREAKLYRELDEKILMDYPNIPHSLIFDRSKALLRGKNQKIFLWAYVGIQQNADTKIGNRNIIGVYVLVFNYMQRPLKVMNFSCSFITIRNSKGKDYTIESMTEIDYRNKTLGIGGKPYVAEVNNNLLLPSRQSYSIYIPPHGFLVLSNSYDITDTKVLGDSLKSDLKETPAYTIKSLSINLTNYAGDEIVLEPFKK